jgi:spore maturation protein CgeB
LKVLVSGYHNPHYFTVTEYIERGVSRLAHELIVFNDRDHLIPGRLRRRWALLQDVSVATINRQLTRLAAKTQPDLVLITGGHRITAQALRRLKRDGFSTALWTTDMPMSGDRMRTTAAEYTFVFSQGTEYAEIFRKMGIANARWLPMACDPELHHPVNLREDEQSEFGHDAAFVGSYYPGRADCLQQLTAFDLAVWGPGWDRLSTNSPLRACVRGLHTPPESWVKIYSASRIIISIHVQDPERRVQVHQASPRIFEALACGAFVLTDSQRDVLALFRDGEHLVSFKDAADLGRKIAYYLEHPDERQRIATAGRAEVLRHHTYAHRVREIISALTGGHPASRCSSGFSVTIDRMRSLSEATA